MAVTSVHVSAGVLGSAIDDAVAALRADDVAARILKRDHTVFADDPTEISNRLGWLDVVDSCIGRVDELVDFRRECVDAGLTHTRVLGMGGSSLFPEVCANVFAKNATGLELGIVDTTHPAAIARITDADPQGATLFVPASKSGSTIETRAQLRWFWDLTTAHRGVEAGAQFAAITDPGSALGNIASSRMFRRVFRNDPNIGGRFSALSLFGLVPASLAGVDVGLLLEDAQRQLTRIGGEATYEDGATRLGAALGAAALAGRDKMTMVIDGDLAPVGVWIEQLVAESTGKLGKGILPVLDEPLQGADQYGDDRIFVVIGAVPPEMAGIESSGHPVVHLGELDANDLGGLVMTFAWATAIACRMLGVNPFDQPDVESAKLAAGQVLSEGATDVALGAVAPLLDTVRPGDFVTITAFVDPEGDVAAGLPAAAARIRKQTNGAAVTVGIGPRYLHSTGQLHKGAAQRCVALQVVDEDGPAIGPRGKVRGHAFTFGQLLRAQADGDLAALRGAGARVARVSAADLLGA